MKSCSVKRVVADQNRNIICLDDSDDEANLQSECDISAISSSVKRMKKDEHDENLANSNVDVNTFVTCPSFVDPEVFSALPVEIQIELSNNNIRYT